MQVNVDGPTDGSEIPLSGPRVPRGATISFKALTPTKMGYVMKLDGKIDNEGSNPRRGRLSFVGVDWIAGKEDYQRLCEAIGRSTDDPRPTVANFRLSSAGPPE